MLFSPDFLRIGRLASLHSAFQLYRYGKHVWSGVTDRLQSLDFLLQWQKEEKPTGVGNTPEHLEGTQKVSLHSSDFIHATQSLHAATKQLVVIPASIKRHDFDIQKPLPEHRPLTLFGVLLGSVAVLLLVTLFVVPLDNGQDQQSLAQVVNHWFTNGHTVLSSTLNPPQQVDSSNTTRQLAGETYCGGSDIWGTCATAAPAGGVMGTGQMQRPMKGEVITQPFGQNEYQQWCGCWRPHNGIDLAAPYGTPVMAADSGQVIWAGWDWSGLGWAVKINHGNYIATIYGHLQRFIVKVGQNVTKGQVIAYEGSTGASTGPHVHFMVLQNNVWINPADYVQLP